MSIQYNREPIQVLLHSKDADVKSNNGAELDFYFNTIEADSQTHIYLKVLHAIIPYSFYQININNNLLNYTLNNVSYNLIIPVGNYNINDLVNYLKNNMDINFTITYNRITNKLTFTHSTFNFTLGGTCLRFLGFSSPIGSINRTITSINAVSLISTHCICIYTTINTGFINCHQGERHNNLLLSIPIDVAQNGIIIYKGTDLAVNTYDNIFNNLHLKLCDMNGNTIDLNGLDWSMSIQLEFRDSVLDNI